MAFGGMDEYRYSPGYMFEFCFSAGVMEAVFFSFLISQRWLIWIRHFQWQGKKHLVQSQLWYSILSTVAFFIRIYRNGLSILRLLIRELGRKIGWF